MSHELISQDYLDDARKAMRAYTRITLVQIVFLAKHFRATDWHSLSIPAK